MTPWMKELNDFFDKCERLSRSTTCPACVTKSDYALGFRAFVVISDLNCGILLCRGCGYMLIIPKGGAHAVVPHMALLYAVMNSEAGPAIAAVMAETRLRREKWCSRRFRLKVGRG